MDIPSIRRQFPILDQRIHGHPLIYLDSAATAQKPRAVLAAMTAFYETANGNPHRGMHVLAERATEALEGARDRIRRFLNARRPEEIILTKNCTEAINLVAQSLGRSTLKKGDAVVLSILEHHSNIVPWLQLKEQIGVEIRWIDIDENGRLNMNQMTEHLRDGRVKLLSITAQSNVLGTRPPIGDIITAGHDAGTLVLIDAAQSIAHMPTDVQALDCDFLTFSGHKLYGPTGIGVLYGKKEMLGKLPPFLGGGMMIREVMTDGFSSTDLPQKFEAGTQPVAEAVGLAAAIDWLEQFPVGDREAHERNLIDHAFASLRSIPGLTILGSKNPAGMHGCLSFVIDGVHPHDLTDILGKQGICLRAGHHCAQPLHKRLGMNATTRLSIGIYNTKEEIDRCTESLARTVGLLKGE